ncbi:MAG TPA: hypothetical protein PLY81_06465 [Chitinophagaceae bacterium]|nr:hypothetical protein [Chitinophagaceae bacterium]HNF29906.1 hypothetical protein [Chitinophagaceae bacterium]HNM35153.1 hypothetical protein [Chitinophagaceae bacterium]
MKKLFLLLTVFIFFQANAQKIQEKLFYHSAKGLSFIPPLSKPGLIYEGKLYIGKQRLTGLFYKLNDETLNSYFNKYKANKTAADILTITGGVALPLANIFIAANEGKVNWWLIAASALLNGTGGYLNMQAQKNLLLSSIYFDKKMGYTTNNFKPKQQVVQIAIPIGK